MIEERIDDLIRTYQSYIAENCKKIDSNVSYITYRLKHGFNSDIQSSANKIKGLRKENELLRMFIESLECIKTGAKGI